VPKTAKDMGDIVHRLVPRRLFELVRPSVKAWKELRLRGKFVVFEQIEHGAVFVDVRSGQAYLVVGIAQSVAEVLLTAQLKLPCVVTTTLLPFGKWITYDVGICSSPQLQNQRDIDRAGKILATEDTIIIETFDIPAWAHEPDPIWSGLEWEGAPPLPALLAFQKPVVDMAKRLGSRFDSLTVRRFGYTKADNPNNLLCVCAEHGMVVMKPCAKLMPSLKEVVAVLDEALRKLSGKPEMLQVDMRDYVLPVRAMLGPAKIEVSSAAFQCCFVVCRLCVRAQVLTVICAY
jgi:hypothetical protein